MYWLITFIPALLGFLSSLVCKYNVEEQDRPSFQPSNWVFPVVWNIIYVLYGLCAYLALTYPSINGGYALFFSIWTLNLLLNVSWTPVFACGTSLNRSKVSLWIIIALILTLLMLMCVTIIRYQSLSMTLCLVPYITWLFVAYSLNLEIIRLRTPINS